MVSDARDLCVTLWIRKSGILRRGTLHSACESRGPDWGKMMDSFDVAGVSSDVILGLSDEEAPNFVSDRVAKKTLHLTVQQLNKDVLSNDPERRDKASRALRKLGFV